MTSRSLTTVVIFQLLILFSAIPHVSAQTVPSFPTCVNPQGTVKVTYGEGTHGIAGNSGTFTGSDTVFTLSGETSMQCFCADNGDGTQSNWWHATSLSAEEVQILKNQGWISVPNGALWGLAEGEWLVFNSPYACPKSEGNGDGNNNNNNNNTSSSSNSSGDVLGATTDPGGSVLGLASTGNIATIYLLAGFGLLLLLISFLLRKLSQNNA